MKIYTKTGDDGTTGLFGGGRVDKDAPIIDAFGTVDETNAVLGLAASYLTARPETRDLRSIIESVQNDLFVVGADLATPIEATVKTTRIRKGHIERLERHIDEVEAHLNPLKQFILPGGSPASAALHVARATCRRAERLTVAASRQRKLNLEVIHYLNRLSDLLFVIARWGNMLDGQSDTKWTTDSA